MVSRVLLVTDRTLVFVACVAILGIMGMTSVSVIGRYFFAAPVTDDLLISEMLVVFAVYLPMGYVQLHDGHIKVTVFTERMSARAQRRLDTFGLLLGAVVIGLIAGATFDDFYLAWSENQYQDGPLELPEWPSRFAVFLGLTVLWLRLVLDAISHLLPGHVRYPPPD